MNTRGASRAESDSPTARCESNGLRKRYSGKPESHPRATSANGEGLRRDPTDNNATTRGFHPSGKRSMPQEAASLSTQQMLQENPNGGITVWQWNCRGFTRKRAMLQYNAKQDTPPDVIALHETWKSPRMTGYHTHATAEAHTATLTAIDHTYADMGIDHVFTEIVPQHRGNTSVFILNIYIQFAEGNAGTPRQLGAASEAASWTKRPPHIRRLQRGARGVGVRQTYQKGNNLVQHHTTPPTYDSDGSDISNESRQQHGPRHLSRYCGRVQTSERRVGKH